MALFSASFADAATFGHARMASADGEPLVIVVPVTGLTQAESESLSARPAPESAWKQAGLVPPVSLATLQVAVTAAPAGGTGRVLRIHSPQVFSGALADLLLDVRTVTGSERYQVSLVTSGPQRAAAAPPAAGQAQGSPGPAVGKASSAAASGRMGVRAIRVRKGDTMFAIARHHAVRGVSVYQLMLALQRANPQAFIHENINLVRAGATLKVPSLADMLSISDAEARRQFVAQTAAFYRLRHRAAGADIPTVGSAEAVAGSVSRDAGPEVTPSPAPPGDQLRLSGGSADTASDERAAQGHALKDAESRIGQLEQNVQTLNQALQAQGQAAGDAAQTGAGAIAGSIRKIAGAISEASHEAAAQADDRNRAEAATQGGPVVPASGSTAAASQAASGSTATASQAASESGNPVGTAPTAAPGGRVAPGGGDLTGPDAATASARQPAASQPVTAGGGTPAGSRDATGTAAGTTAAALSAGTVDSNAVAAPGGAAGTATSAAAGATGAAAAAGARSDGTAPSVAPAAGQPTHSSGAVSTAQSAVGSHAAPAAGPAATAPAATAPAAAGSASANTQAGIGGPTAPGGSPGAGSHAAGGTTSGAGGGAKADAAQPLFSGDALGAGASGTPPVTEAQAHANAEVATHEASLQTRHRVSWLQDHLLGVMTGLLAVIVFIIAWLLRRASAGRDEGDDEPQVTAAMVREKLEGVDLELPPTGPEPKGPTA